MWISPWGCWKPNPRPGTIGIMSFSLFIRSKSETWYWSVQVWYKRSECRNYLRIEERSIRRISNPWSTIGDSFNVYTRGQVESQEERVEFCESTAKRMPNLQKMNFNAKNYPKRTYQCHCCCAFCRNQPLDFDQDGWSSLRVLIRESAMNIDTTRDSREQTTVKIFRDDVDIREQG